MNPPLFVRWLSCTLRARVAVLSLLALACIGSFVAARRARDRYIATNADAAVLGEKIGKVMPESGRFYTAMAMLSQVATTNSMAADLVRRYGINFVNPKSGEAVPSS